MATKKINIRNKSSKPDNIIVEEKGINDFCIGIEREFPNFFSTYFSYLRSSVLPKTRLAYLKDVYFFFEYIVNDSGLTNVQTIKELTIDDLNKIKAIHINTFLDNCRHYEKEDENDLYIYENNNITLARKKSSLSVLFKQLFRSEVMKSNITDGFNPIRIPRPHEREIKALQDNEVMTMLDAVTTGNGLTKKEYQEWERTKLRDKAILIMFLTYGLRLNELFHLNLESINWERGEFKIYRKRGKESIMPLNISVSSTLKNYIEIERRKFIKDNDETALFLSRTGNRLSVRQINNLVKKYTSIGLKSSRREGYSPHKLRATAATSLIGRGSSIYDVAKLLDHEQVTTTQLYAAHKMNVKRDLVSMMEWEVERKEGEKTNE